MKRQSALMILVTLAMAFAIAPATSTRPASAAGACATGLTLTLHPGLPPTGKRVPFPVARNIPRRAVTVSAPVYPGAQPLATFVASAVQEYPEDPYLETGVAEYQTPASVQTVTAWYRNAFRDCGWRIRGTMSTNASALTSGITFQSTGNHNLALEMSFGDTPSGGAYIAYAAEDIVYPLRPAKSYLHGPFSEVRIAVRRGVMQNAQPVWHVVNTTVLDRPTIVHLVKAVNAIKDYHTASGICLGGFSLNGPVWLSFIRPHGSVVHAFESGPGGCGGLGVNGVRWLVDRGRVWNLVMAISRAGAGGK